MIDLNKMNKKFEEIMEKETFLNKKQTIQCNIDSISGSFSWTTEYYHNDNSFTMTDFLENFLSDDVEIYLNDGSYAEIRIENKNYALDAKGNGDSYNHIVEWNMI
jgi:cellobiose phosphorylase